MDFGLVSTWVGILLAISGFGITFWQLRITKSAALAARSAAEQTRAGFKRDAIRLRLNQLVVSYSNISVLASTATADQLAAYLRAWRIEAAGLLPLVGDNEELTTALSTAIRIIALAGDDLVFGSQEHGPAVKRCLRTMGIACDEASKHLTNVDHPVY